MSRTGKVILLHRCHKPIELSHNRICTAAFESVRLVIYQGWIVNYSGLHSWQVHLYVVDVSGWCILPPRALNSRTFWIKLMSPINERGHLMPCIGKPYGTKDLCMSISEFPASTWIPEVTLLKADCSNLAINSQRYKLTTHARSRGWWSILPGFGSMISNQGDEMVEYWDCIRDEKCIKEFSKNTWRKGRLGRS
jgi:hypothetical protein